MLSHWITAVHVSYFHFTDENTEVPRDQVTFLRVRSKQGVEPELEFRSV